MKRNLKSYIVLIVFGILLIGAIVCIIYLSIASPGIVSDYNSIKTVKNTHMKPVYKLEESTDGSLVLQTTIEKDLSLGSSTTALSGDKPKVDLSGTVDTGGDDSESDTTNGGTGTDPDAGPETVEVNPIQGDTFTFASVGTLINIYQAKTGVTSSHTLDSYWHSNNWEFSYNYILTSSEYPTMAKRAKKIQKYVTNPDAQEVLRVNLNGESMVVGCAPPGFGGLGDILEWKFDDGSTYKMLVIDAKAVKDSASSVDTTNYYNTTYGHGNFSGETFSVDTFELWSGGGHTSKANKVSIGNPLTCQIVGHTDIFN